MQRLLRFQGYFNRAPDAAGLVEASGEDTTRPQADTFPSGVVVRLKNEYGEPNWLVDPI